MEKTSRKMTTSSVLLHPVTLCGWLAGCVLAAYHNQVELTIFTGFVFILTGVSFLWGRTALEKVGVAVSGERRGVFPGQTCELKFTVQNDKLLPLLWLELLLPCDVNGPLQPEQEYLVETAPSRERDAGQATTTDADVEEKPRHYCLYGLSLVKWRQTIIFRREWQAVRRGIFQMPQITLRSGDGFGLSALERVVALGEFKRIVVYPKIVAVATDKILQDMWDSRSASWGYLEDITVIKSIRDYLPQDSAKRINHRLLASGQGMKVNAYETVTPDAVFFVVDAASFRTDEEQLEEALSVVGSFLLSLTQRGVQCGLWVPQSAFFAQSFVTPTKEAEGVDQMLELLAGLTVADPALAPQGAVLTGENCGQVYYVAKDCDSVTSPGVFAYFPEHKLTLLTSRRDDLGQAGDIKVRALADFRRCS